MAHRNFLLLWGGQMVTEMGSAVTRLALPLTAVVVLQASTFEVGLLTSAARSAPGLACAPRCGSVSPAAGRRAGGCSSPRCAGVAIPQN
jgi:hypothetical protein